MLERIYRYCEKLEKRFRARLSRWPLLYAFVGGVGVVLFWRGVWHATDIFFSLIFKPGFTPTLFDYVDGPLALAIGILLLLTTGLFISSFIGSSIISSGLRGEEKLTEKTEHEIKAEESELSKLTREVKNIESVVEDLQQDIHAHYEHKDQKP